MSFIFTKPFSFLFSSSSNFMVFCLIHVSSQQELHLRFSSRISNRYPSSCILIICVSKSAMPFGALCMCNSNEN